MGKSNNWGIAFVVGATAGYVASLFMSESSRKKQKEFITAKSEELKLLLADPDERERVKTVFTDYSEESADYYRQIKQDLVDGLAKLKGTVADIDKKKYQETLGNIITDFKDKGKVGDKELEKLRSHLEQDFTKIKKSVVSAAPKKTVKKKA